jgi:ABC-type nitrate/sulfonate/bicarbonate transport system permease component
VSKRATLSSKAVLGVRQLTLSPGSRVYGVLTLIVFFILWWVAAAWVARNIARPQVILPSPIDVVQSIPGLAVFLGEGTNLTYANAAQAIFKNTVASGVRLLGGLLLGTVLGVGTGLLLGWSPRLRYMAEGPLLTIRTIPLLALIPLFLAWFGGRAIGGVVYIAFAVFSMLLINTLEAIRNVDPTIRHFALTLGSSRLHVYKTVVMPAIIPELAGGMRVVLGLAWAILLAAEYLAAQSGIGRMLILAQEYSYTDRMILILLLIVVYTFVLDRGFAALAERITRWVPR